MDVPMADSTRPTSSTVLLVVSHSPIVDYLYGYLSVADMFSFRLVCSIVHRAVKKWLLSAYNIEKHFSHFFDDPMSFRILQARTGAIVSGSNALQFFEGLYYPDSDLDLYVPCRHAYDVAAWLRRNDYIFTVTDKQRASMQGKTLDTVLEQISRRRISIYHERPPTGDDEYGYSAIEDVFNFVRKSNHSRKIQMIIVDPRSTPIAAVLHFHSTLVMNFIAWDRAYSLFPSATFIHRSCLTFGDAAKEPRLPIIYHKYGERGFKISAEPFLTRDLAQLFKWGVRRIDDKWSWKIKLDTEELIAAIGRLEGAYVPTSIHETVGFTLLNRGGVYRTDMEELRRNPDRTRYRDRQAAIYYRELYSPVLKSALILPFTTDEEEPFGKVIKLLQTQESFQKSMAKVANPGVDLSEGMNPDAIRGWTYWDKEVLDMVRSTIHHAAGHITVEGLD
ncbi:hypothetical protein M408DRAFT_26867 [Serendipita vermifera MAFF 305830]|uniref:Uncharacterized protein n=1 Tax=Serendipita vermifera MAFF 305830 TaxID=933852 RepID=A0A0C2X5I3_SERVB|nr:hypothetical protein M408DRAFT_26867 [Serendipita vermifera MAFF 305830]